MFNILNDLNTASYGREETGMLYIDVKTLCGEKELADMTDAPTRRERMNRRLFGTNGAAKPIYKDKPMVVMSGL